MEYQPSILSVVSCIACTFEPFPLVRQAATSRFARWREMTLHLSSCNPSFLKRSVHEVYSHLSATLTNKLIQVFYFLYCNPKKLFKKLTVHSSQLPRYHHHHCPLPCPSRIRAQVAQRTYSSMSRTQPKGAKGTSFLHSISSPGSCLEFASWFTYIHIWS